MKRIALFLILFLAAPVVGMAQGSESFSIRLFSLADNTPPSVPSPVTVDPVASTQIDVTWGVSTDDFVLAGYVLFRDNVAIATTTLNSFSDSGLTASTTYSYYVQAYDNAGNYSATSTTVATTTLTTPVVATTTTSSGTSGTAVRTVLESFAITPFETSARFELSTARPARIEVRWGRTASYELGYTFLEPYVRNFSTAITDLEPGTTYEYQVIGYTPSGASTVLQRGQFRTLSAMATAPENVQAFTGSIDSTDVLLRWRLPAGNVAAVRIVRSHLGFPLSPTDGAIVYQGLGTNFIDEQVLEQYSPAYYTAFVIDSAGNVSSGAVVLAALDTTGDGVILSPQATPAMPVTVDDEIAIYDEAATTSADTRDLERVRIPTKGEILLVTETGTQSFADVKPTINENEKFSVVVPVTAVSTNLKTILFTIDDPGNPESEYSYILRLNKEGDAYEAVLGAIGSSGASTATLAVYDYRAKVVATYQKEISFAGTPRGEQMVWFPDRLYQYAPWIGAGAGGFLAILVLLSWLYRRQV